MKTFVFLSIAAWMSLGCSANIYRVKPDTTMCDSVVTTDCKDPPPDPNLIKLCGNAFANFSDFEAEAKHYCEKPVLRNCALQCCDVDCGQKTAPPAPPPAAATPAAPANAAQAPAAATQAPTTMPPKPSSTDEELPPAPPPPPGNAAPAPPTVH